MTTAYAASRPRTAVVLQLGLAQTLAWASSFYLPAMLATPMAAELGVSRPTVFAVLSMALVVSALISPWAGRQIDRRGGRAVLMTSTTLFVIGLVLLGLAPGMGGLLLAWLVLGLAMGSGLYDAAFAALVHLYGREARQPITGITLIAGFASTVGWPLSSLMEAHWGWRGACLGWASLHLLLALPLHACLPGRQDLLRETDLVASSGPTLQSQPRPAVPRHMAPLLALLFTLMGFVGTAIATHLPTLLQASGATLSTAVAAAALLGPAQVAARLLELGLLRRRSPLLTARIAALGHPLAAAVLLSLGAGAALPFVVLHGLGNGLLTIVIGTLPLALFGAAGYGARQGWIALPGRVVSALSPWVFGLAIERWGSDAIWLSASIGLGAFLLLLAVRLPRA